MLHYHCSKLKDFVFQVIDIHLELLLFDIKLIALEASDIIKESLWSKKKIY